MVNDESQRHKHCWHLRSSYVNGLATAGSEQYICCHCGQIFDRAWHASPDPAHGPWCEQYVKHYERELPK